MGRDKGLQAVLDRWPEQAEREALTAFVMDFLLAYGEFAYLCPEQFHLGGEEATIALATRAGLRPGQRVLDVGCFLGGPARYLARVYGCRVTGLDIDPSVVAAAKRLTAAEGPGVAFVAGDAWQMPFAAGSFDVVWGQDAWPHRPGLFEECARVLATGGIIAFSNSVRGERFAPDDTICYDAYTAEEYAAQLGEAGFTVLSREDITAEAEQRWQELFRRLSGGRDMYQSWLGTERYTQELRELRTIIRDYRKGRIGHCRFVARKS